MPKKTFYNLSIEKQDRIITAAIDEFAERSFESANLSTIIKNAKIPRGSFYQYFDDKKDLLIYLLKIIGEKKLEYMSELMVNPKEVPFLTLFKELYLAGMKFALENSKYIKIAANIISTKGHIYDEIMKDGLEQALQFYIDLIELDKQRGRIKMDIDSYTFAQIVVNITNNITISELDVETNEFNYDKMIERITHTLKIFEMGVKQGDYDV